MILVKFHDRVWIFLYNENRVKNCKFEHSPMTQTQPTVTPKLNQPKFGFNEYAERLNGRAAMIGFVLMLIIEYLTGKGLLAWLGLI